MIDDLPRRNLLIRKDRTATLLKTATGRPSARKRRAGQEQTGYSTGEEQPHIDSASEG